MTTVDSGRGNRTYALVIGIDRYAAVPGLHGCRHDAEAARAVLAARTEPGSLHTVELYDAEATRQAVIDGIRQHLGRAGSGDTAILWYAGHGSQAPVPPELWPTEPSGLLQTLVCADSRSGDVPDLYDKELFVLLDQVAARAGHVAVVLDSCHSGGAVRGATPARTEQARLVDPATRTPRPEQLIPELRHSWAAVPDRSRVVALTACRADQLAAELPLEGARVRGVFSWALLRALDELGPRATYRELLAAARCAVEDTVLWQVPQLAGDEPADQPFLGGVLRQPASAITMRHLRGGWEIDVGACHGVPDGPARIAVAGDGPVRAARVVSVEAQRSIVEPAGWTPDPRRQYPVVFTELPQAALAVAVSGPGGVAAGIAGQIDASAYLRPAGSARPDLRFRVEAEPGRTRIESADGVRLAPDVATVEAVRAGERIARWLQVRRLANPRSGLAGGVRLELVPARPGERSAPLDRPALRAGDDGLIRLRYRLVDGVWQAPTVFVLLRNTTGLPLYCALLDLTGRFRIHAALFPGDFVAARGTGAAFHGKAVRFRLPADEPVVPGAHVRDWLKLIVAADAFASRPFEQEALGVADRRGALPRIRVTRNAEAADPDDPYDWTATTVGVRTEVPA